MEKEKQMIWILMTNMILTPTNTWIINNHFMRYDPSKKLFYLNNENTINQSDFEIYLYNLLQI